MELVKVPPNYLVQRLAPARIMISADIFLEPRKVDDPLAVSFFGVSRLPLGTNEAHSSIDPRIHASQDIHH